MSLVISEHAVLAVNYRLAIALQLQGSPRAIATDSMLRSKMPRGVSGTAFANLPRRAAPTNRAQRAYCAAAAAVLRCLLHSAQKLGRGPPTVLTPATNPTSSTKLQQQDLRAQHGDRYQDFMLARASKADIGDVPREVRPRAAVPSCRCCKRC